MPIFRRRQRELEAPPGLNQHHDFSGSPPDQNPGDIVPYVPTGNRMLGGSGGVGLAGWAPRAGIEMPPIANQDALLTHWQHEPAANPTSKYHGDPHYIAKNQDAIARRNYDEYLRVPENAAGFQIVTEPQTGAVNPNRFPPAPSRPTAFQSPSAYRFQHKIRSGHGDTPHLSGEHFSMASMQRNYPIRGMQPARRFRNTWRLEPTPRDDASVDMPGAPPELASGQYVSPNLGIGATNGGTWRLQ
jgi:hypothetical protein